MKSQAYRYGFEKASNIIDLNYHYLFPNLAAATDAYFASKAMQDMQQMQPTQLPTVMDIPPVHHRRHYHHRTG